MAQATEKYAGDTAKEIVSPTDSEKEVAVPSQNTDKQIFSRTLDSSKEVRDNSSDTQKTFVPALPPVNSEKQVPHPTSNTDKETLTTTSHDSSSTYTTAPAILALRIQKASSLGLIMPQNQTLTLRSLDPATKLEQGAAFVTSEMEWTDVCAGNPPFFELFTAHDANNPVMVARCEPRGWQGVSSMKSELTVSCPPSGSRQRWEVLRKTLGRSYALSRLGDEIAGGAAEKFVWKGSTKTVKAMVGAGEEEKLKKGNLKLTTADGNVVLAVWQQWRDSAVLGDLTLFEGAKETLAAEVVVASCICVVSAERALGTNWFGGIGK